MNFDRQLSPDLPIDDEWQVEKRSDSDAADANHEWRQVWSDGQGLIVSCCEAHPMHWYRLCFDGSTVFDVIPSKRLISISGLVEDDQDLTVDHLLNDQVKPRVLAHDGRLVLHSSAIQIRDQAVLFVGESGSGKSTLAASFERSGAPLLGDDIVIVDLDGPRAIGRALYKSLRLLPDSLAALFPPFHPSSAVANYGFKRRPALRTDVNGSNAPIKIAAIFVIDCKSAAEIEVNAMSPTKLCVSLLTQSFALNPADLERAAGKLRKISLLASRVPAFSLDFPRDYSRLPMVRERVLSAVDVLFASKC